MPSYKLSTSVKIVLFLFCILSCKKEKHSPEDTEKVSMDFLSTVFYQAELVQVPFSGHFEATYLKATLGGKDLLLLKTDEHFCFIVPADVTGNLALTSNQLSDSYEITVHAIAAEEQDPDAYLENFLSEQESVLGAVSANLDSLIAMGVLDKQGATSQLKTISDSLSHKARQFKSLPANEKQVAIKYLKANDTQFTAIASLLDNRLRPAVAKVAAISKHQSTYASALSVCAEQEAIKQAHCIIFNELIPAASKITGSVLLNHAAVALSVDIGAGLAVASGLTYYQLIPAVIQLKTSLEQIGRESLQYVGEIANEIPASSSTRDQLNAQSSSVVESSAGNNKFENQFKRKLNFKIRSRNLQPSLDSATFESLFNAYDYFLTIWNLPFADRLFGPKPYWPKETSRYVLPEKIEYLRLSDDNPNVIGTISGTVDQLEIAFQTDELTDQQFNYTITYNDGISTISTGPIAAHLEAIHKNYVIELYERELLYGIPYPNNTAVHGPVKTIKVNDVWAAYNNVGYAIKAKYKGEYVKTSRTEEYGGIHFSSESVPYGPDDVTIEGYLIRFKDVTNDVDVRFPVKLTLLNTLHRMLIGKTVEINYMGNHIVDLLLKEDGTTEGHSRPVSYSLIYGTNYPIYPACAPNGTQVIGTRMMIGEISLDLHGANLYGMPSGIAVFDDGNMGPSNIFHTCHYSFRIKETD